MWCVLLEQGYILQITNIPTLRGGYSFLIQLASSQEMERSCSVFKGDAMSYAVIGWLEGTFYRKDFCSYGDACNYEANLEAAGATSVDLFTIPSDLPF